MWFEDNNSTLQSGESDLSPANVGERELPSTKALLLLRGQEISAEGGLVIPTGATGL